MMRSQLNRTKRPSTYTYISFHLSSSLYFFSFLSLRYLALSVAFVLAYPGAVNNLRSCPPPSIMIHEPYFARKVSHSSISAFNVFFYRFASSVATPRLSLLFALPCLASLLHNLASLRMVVVSLAVLQRLSSVMHCQGFSICGRTPWELEQGSLEQVWQAAALTKALSCCTAGQDIARRCRLGQVQRRTGTSGACMFQTIWWTYCADLRHSRLMRLRSRS